MTRLVASLIFSILMTKLIFCQTVYPRKVVIDKDTVCIISTEQVRQLNNVFIDRDECNELKDSLNSQLNTYDKLTKAQQEVINSQDKEIVLQKKIVEEKDVIIHNDEKMLKKQGRQVTWLKIQRTVLAASTLVLGITVFILTHK